MTLPRASGILLHPTSLTGPCGIGDLGHAAYRFIDFLESSGQKFWQVLPLGPTSYGNSPYMSYSALAGNPLLISPEFLAEKGLLSSQDFADPFPEDIVNFDLVIPYKRSVLRKAFANFQKQESHAEFEVFCAAEAHWLEDYALFMALVEEQPHLCWHQWSPELARRQPEAIAAKKQELQESVMFQQWQQFCFFQQWQALRQYAHQKHIEIIGDIPIYVAHHSADVWANPENFALDPETFTVALMAGVPPDYFSATGQLWGNPIYNWEFMQKNNFSWWIGRFQHLQKLVDWIRIDHFRGFEAYWQVSAGEHNAINGKWQKAPGEAFFEVLKEKLGSLPILAEDLGVITPEVESLRDRFAFPGMRVLLFGFGGDSYNPHLPHNYVTNSLVYTGTHDNDTTIGWWLKAPEHEKAMFCRYLGLATKPACEEIPWLVLRTAMASVSKLCIVPMQDLLHLDNSARMNRPGLGAGNWSWRLPNQAALSAETSRSLLEITRLYSRA